MRVDILALFLNVGKIIHSFTIVYDVRCKFFRDVVYHPEMVPFFPNLLKVFIVIHA
jgi:hypothetical protein